MAEPDPISDDDLRDVSRWLEAALSKTSQEERHELVGRGVRALTRVWATANPDFGDDTWHPVRTTTTNQAPPSTSAPLYGTHLGDSARPSPPTSSRT